jgi:hypothetical protein
MDRILGKLTLQQNYQEQVEFWSSTNQRGFGGGC